MLLFPITLLLISLLSGATSLDVPAPKFTVSLDAAPQDRWTEPGKLGSFDNLSNIQTHHYPHRPNAPTKRSQLHDRHLWVRA